MNQFRALLHGSRTATAVSGRFETASAQRIRDSPQCFARLGWPGLPGRNADMLRADGGLPSQPLHDMRASAHRCEPGPAVQGEGRSAVPFAGQSGTEVATKSRNDMSLHATEMERDLTVKWAGNESATLWGFVIADP